MSYFYAQEMTYCECMCAREIGWQVMNKLGALQCAHFISHTLDYENLFVRNLRRCQESLIKLDEVKKFITEIKKEFKLIQPKTYQSMLTEFDKDIEQNNIQGHLFMNEIEDEINELHGYIISQKKQLQNHSSQGQNLVNQAALLIALMTTGNFRQMLNKNNISDFNIEQNHSMFDFKCLLINRKDQLLISRGLFRISRGNAWFQLFEIPQERIIGIFQRNCKQIGNKIACIVIFPKGEQNILSQKINRFMSCIEHTTIHSLPEQWDEQLLQIQARAQQIHGVQDLSMDAIERYLHKLYESKGNSEVSRLTYLQMYARKQKQIYKQLACAQMSNNFLHFNIFIPTKSLPLHIQPNEHLPPLIMKVCSSDKSPPSKFDMPEILEYPQAILNTYGVPNYDQFNPAVFYIVTFGFFIGVMFGDIGHTLMAIGILLYFKVNIWAWTVVFFMGYCGLIYNEFFGLNLGLFSSCYQFNGHQATLKDNCVYPFGIDSAWKPSSNYMPFTNSLKMKLAVILGVTHMLLGLTVRLINGVKRRNLIDIFTITIPQIVFMLCTFVYMDFLIIFKWITPFKPKQAPSIIATMIAVYANFGTQKDLVFWSRERAFQKVVVAIAAIMIPIMLLVKPVITCLRRKPKALAQQVYEMQDIVSDQIDDKFSDHEFQSDKIHKPQKHYNHKEEETIQEIFVNQFIETIEFVLGSISNTASYLRLWALSLAHGQLSEVIFELILLKFIKSGYSGIPGLLIAFPFFLLVTFGVLICMDFLECFLHSLRLHWVEFQNKFYAGRGYEFQPYSFKSITQFL